MDSTNYLGQVWLSVGVTDQTTESMLYRRLWERMFYLILREIESRQRRYDLNGPEQFTTLKP